MPMEINTTLLALALQRNTKYKLVSSCDMTWTAITLPEPFHLHLPPSTSPLPSHAQSVQITTRTGDLTLFTMENAKNGCSNHSSALRTSVNPRSSSGQTMPPC